MPLAVAVENVESHQGANYLRSTKENIAHSVGEVKQRIPNIQQICILMKWPYIKIEGLMTRVQPTQVFQQLVALKLDMAPSLLTL